MKIINLDKFWTNRKFIYIIISFKMQDFFFGMMMSQFYKNFHQFSALLGISLILLYEWSNLVRKKNLSKIELFKNINIEINTKFRIKFLLSHIFLILGGLFHLISYFVSIEVMKIIYSINAGI